VAVDEYGPVIDDIYEYAEIQGIEIDGITQEGGAGQLEINLRHGDPIKLADDVFFFKRLIREAALKHDCFATFMAKPIEGEPGSAMHVHHSVVDARGRNIFTGPHGGETDAFFNFIGGLQEHMPSVIAMFAPYVNSYRRYVRDMAAPINLEWGRDNRTTGIRIPVSDRRFAPDREPAGGDGLQPLPLHGREPCLRLSGHDERDPPRQALDRRRL
jgi:glutamine synthetase